MALPTQPFPVRVEVPLPHGGLSLEGLGSPAQRASHGDEAACTE